MSEHSEISDWLKSLSPLHGSNLERLSNGFIKKGFKSNKSLTFIQPGDLDDFFPSPNRLFLAERRVLETEISQIKADYQKSKLQPKQLVYSDCGARNKETPDLSSDSSGFVSSSSTLPVLQVEGETQM